MKRSLLIAVAILAGVIFSRAAAHQDVRSPTSLETGRLLFQTSCTPCHGENGRGDGPSAQTLSQVPDDLSSLEVKQMGNLELFNAIRRGVPETPMPGFAGFSDEEIWSIVKYVGSLND